MEAEEINLKELLDFFIGKIWLIVIIVITTLVLGLSYSIVIKKPLYNSNVSVILVNKNSTQTSTIFQSDLIINQKLASTYREIVKSRRVLKRVIENLELNYSVEKLSNMIVVSNINDTEMLRISVNSPSPRESYEIANETAEIFKKEIIEIYNLENVSIIDEAEIDSNPYNINHTKDILIYIIVGIVISCGIIFLIYYFDNTIKSAEQIENNLKVPVIGTIPKLRKKGE